MNQGDDYEANVLAACARKTRHPDRAAAQRALAHQLNAMDGRKGRGNGGRLSVFACPFCGGFHVGGSNNRNRRRDR